VEGFVIDVRSVNSGASAENAMDVAGFFVTDTTSPYGFDQYREEVDGDPATHELGPPIPKTIEADRVQSAPFTGPVAVLTGEVCWISCEWFVAMMELAPNVRSFGASTRGRSSDWQEGFLDDDETYLISSSSLATLPDGTILEWNGIAPDEPVAFDEDELEDDVLEAAIAWLEGT
jgi:C-terminal processing protease CtpA/Prc